MNAFEAAHIATELRKRGDLMVFLGSGDALKAHACGRWFATYQFSTAEDVANFVARVRDAIDEFQRTGIWVPQIGELRHGKRVIAIDRDNQTYRLDGEEEMRPWQSQ